VKFCYVDESGTGSEPIATMVGILVDYRRMHITKSEWAGLLQSLSDFTGQQIAELHTADFYSGNGVWRGMDGPQRSRIISLIFEWISERKHRIVYTSVNKELYFKSRASDEMPKEINTIWKYLGFHLVLAIQRYSQPEKGNKGHTVLTFDNEEREEKRFIQLIKTPPEWSDEYYAKEKPKSD
jgi:hypothetical protein